MARSHSRPFGLSMLPFLLLAAFACGPSTPERPNVLLLTIDTLRPDYLGAYGFPHGSSPEIDALAAEGVVFERAIAAATTTAPSHASIMTSRYPRGHSIAWSNGGTKLDGMTTLATLFREAGYATAGFVSNLVLMRRTGFDLGFDHYDDRLPDTERNRTNIYERIAEETTSRVLGWLSEQSVDPFFLWVHYQDPHGPYDPPSEHQGQVLVPAEADERALRVLDNNTGQRGIPSYQALEGLFLPSDYKSRYSDEIRYADASIGRLIRAVESHAPDRETVVLLTADHGEAMGEGERWFVHAWNTMPPMAQVPMILRAPGIAPGRASGLVHHVDVLPTLAEFAGLEAPPGSRGVALGPLLREGRTLPDRFVFCDIGFELTAYRSDRFVRVLRAPWNYPHPGQTDAGEPLPPAWLAFSWPASGEWSLVETDEGVKEPIRRYFEQEVSFHELPDWDQETADRLRALGYLGE